MEAMEQLELEAHRGEMVKDMNSLVEKYRTIFDWDIPEINQQMADKLIVAAMHTALDEIAAKLAD
ncbi:MAG: hypothetical protein WC426_12495 [Sulfuriferula sp.]